MPCEMNHIQTSLDRGKKTRRGLPFGEDEAEKPSDFRRATLPSSKDVSKMAMACSRAKLIRDFVAADSPAKEFTSNYRMTSRFFDPRVSITSHTQKLHNIEEMPVISTYPLLVKDMSYNAPADKISKGSRTELVTERKFKCKCDNCVMEHCPGKNSRKKLAFKDNIMTFCDRSTMTPKFAHANCGGTPIPSTQECVAPTISMVAVRDTDCISPIPDMCHVCAHTPILKNFSGPSYCCHKGAPRNGYTGEIVRHIDPNNGGLKTKKSLKCFFRLGNQKSREEIPTEQVTNIYNEGISDDIVNQLPVCPQGVVQVPVPSDVVSEANGVYTKSSYFDSDAYIPFSHKYDSKYHSSCQAAKDKDSCHLEKHHEMPRHTTRPSLKVVRKTYTKPSAPCPKPLNIHLPRRVLTSERDIETFVGKNHYHKYRER